ncbi:MAG: hypothetical protein ACYTG3_16910 [Planctomycetota bacterium]
MDPTGVALIFGGIMSLLFGLALQLFKPKPGPWPMPGIVSYFRPFDRVRPSWCYWLGLGLIVAGIVW